MMREELIISILLTIKFQNNSNANETNMKNASHKTQINIASNNILGKVLPSVVPRTFVLVKFSVGVFFLPLQHFHISSYRLKHLGGII